LDPLNAAGKHLVALHNAKVKCVTLLPYTSVTRLAGSLTCSEHRLSRITQKLTVGTDAVAPKLIADVHEPHAICKLINLDQKQEF
jgi:hypothetical protein